MSLLTKRYCTKVVNLTMDKILNELDLIYIKNLLRDDKIADAVEYVRTKGEKEDGKLSGPDFGTTYYEVAPLFIQDLKEEMELLEHKEAFAFKTAEEAIAFLRLKNK